ncbi:MAG: GGDEF domain-containing protein [Polyangiaceae bacterium]|jgi:two-component system cell cycle response regulator|nr:GGDEF domain-containing protein [Polyangiaceae bacterium]
MRPLVRAAIAVRRALLGAATLLLCACLAAFVVYDAGHRVPLVYAVLAGGLIAALVARRLKTRLDAIEPAIGTELEIGALAMIGAYLLVVRADASLDGAAYPAVYLCLAVVAAFGRPGAALVALATAVAIEIAIILFAFGRRDPWEAAPHIAFMLIFTGFNAAVLRTELARVRTAMVARLKDEVEKLRTEARSYRLLGGAAEAPKPSDDERLLRSGVEEIHQSVLFALRLVRQALELNTAMLLWKNDAGSHLRISELVTDEPELFEGPFLVGDGVFGAALSKGSIVTLEGLKEGYKLPYYPAACPVRTVCVVPVQEHGSVRGLLVVDRIDDRPFTKHEQTMLQEAAEYAVRAIHNERVFLQLERAKAEQGKLYRAAEALNAAKSEQDVIEAGVRSAREVTSVDYAALTLYDDATKTHEIRAISGDFEEGDGTAAVGARFRANTGLVSMALENRHPLPYRGQFDEKKQTVFTRHTTPPKMPSLFVLPLAAHDRALGTLVLGSRRRGAFGESVRGTLEVMASHMSVSLDGARMMKRLEELATTDGLTGLLNKRAMLDVAEHKIAASRRFGRQLAVLVTDIDHFKKVNDTYGHDVGDVIIKGLGDILRRAKRTTDAVARFGGEEFVIICEETDERGALLLAERVRTELEKTTYFAGPAEGSSEQRTLSVTCSIGVATYPACGTSWEALFKAADTALYASKQGGRNRTTVYSAPPRSERGERAA